MIHSDRPRVDKPDGLSSEEGASLLIVLICVLVVSVLALSLLTFVQVSFQETGAVRAARQANYAADAATELAISNVLNDKTGDLGTIYGPPCTYTLQGVNGTDTTVVCEPNGGAGSYLPNKPVNALLTLSATDFLQLNGNDPLYIDGRVYSHGGFATGQTSNLLISDATVTSEGVHLGDECTTDKVKAALLKTCNSAASIAGNDPNWAQPSLPSITRTAPTSFTCTKKGGSNADIFTFDPGKYTTSPATLADTISAIPANKDCDTDSVLYFKPGVYLFDNVDFSVGAHTVVAGTATGSWLSASKAPPVDGTACDKSKPGSEFVLSRAADLRAVDPNSVPYITLCAGPSPLTQPAISIFGLPSVTGTAIQTSNKPFVFVHGMIYLPKGTAQLTLHNKSQTSFDGGMVLNILKASVSASIKQDTAPISLPACTPQDPCRFPREVIFTATTAGQQRLRSVVQIDDHGGGAPDSGNTLSQWSVLR